MRCRLALMACAAFDPKQSLDRIEIPQCSDLPPHCVCYPFKRHREHDRHDALGFKHELLHPDQFSPAAKSL